MQTDYLIIGQGLAGSILAWSLLKLGKTVSVVTDDALPASRVAAGLLNPVTGQRFVLADKTPELLATARIFYRNLEQNTGNPYFHEQPMARLYNNEKERDHCAKRLAQPDYQPFFSSKALPSELKPEHQGIIQTQTGWLDTNALLDDLYAYLSKHARVIHRPFDISELETDGEGIVWQGMYFAKLICCQGYKMAEDPLFSWLPLQAAHGEILTCESSQTLTDHIINKSKWLLPLDAHRCRIGATYAPEIKQPTIQEESKRELMAFAETLFQTNLDLTCIEHQAGIRPTTKDKQPFIGFHPGRNNIAIFNGFGSRGSLMIPYYAQAFSEHLVSGTPIPEEGDIARHYSLFEGQA